MKEIPKQYLASQTEQKWYQLWERKGCFSADPSKGGEPYTIVIPPPNVTGALHLGHALNNTIQDIIIRWQRMLGKNTLWLPGTDHAGIATQAVVEKRLFEEDQLTRHDIGRDALVEKIWKWKDEYETRILGQLRMMGSSCDWERTRFTLDEVCAKAVRHTFFQFFKKGLIYRGKRLVNWDTHLQTAVADDEIFYETVQSFLWYFKYPVSGKKECLIIATTRPETMLGDTAVAVHPEDDRYKHLIGQKVKLPFVNREIPIIADGILVDREFGTGCVKVTPAHDPNDYNTALRHNLPMINILTSEGIINDNGGPFNGQNRENARSNVVKEMKKIGLVEKIEPYETQIGHSDRSKTPIEPYLSDQWFVKMTDLADLAISAIETDSVKIHPRRYAKSCLDWLSEKRDWCISRQLWWGHRIPIWYCNTCSEEEIKEAFKETESVAWQKTHDNSGWLIGSLDDLAEDVIENHKLIQDPDVLDTWFSSALWPHSTLGWPDKNPELDFFYPTNLLVTSRDIISLWVARMIITSLVNLKTVPFNDVYIHPKILDGEGRTMSKSLGNGVDPLDIIEKYGADALRFTMANLCTENQDARLPVKEEILADGRTINTSEKFELGRNFCNKIWNATRFLLLSIQDFDCQFKLSKKNMSVDDRAILSRLNELIVQVNNSFQKYRFSEGAQALYDFFWRHFCDRYIESVKPFLRDEKDQNRKRVQYILFYILKTFLRLLHPIMPFITEELWQLLHEAVGLEDVGTIMKTVWPESQNKWMDLEAVQNIEIKYDLIRSARNLRAEYNIAPNQAVEFTLRLKNKDQYGLICTEKEGIKKLINASAVNFDLSENDLAFPSDQCLLGIIFLHLQSAIDIEGERNKLEKRINKLENDLQMVQRKLSNTSFTDKAPAAVVDKEKSKLMEIENNLTKLKKVKEYLVVSR